MNKEWCNERYEEYIKEVEEAKQRLSNMINRSERLESSEKEHYLEILQKSDPTYADILELEFMHSDLMINRIKDDSIKDDIDQLNDLCKQIQKDKDKIIFYFRSCKNIYREDNFVPENPFDRYLDSDPVKFEGNIIITDPCYIMKERDESNRPNRSDFVRYNNVEDYPDYDSDELYSKMRSEEDKKYDEAYQRWNDENPDDWDVCNCGYRLDKLGITSYITRDTIYGDWSCTTFNLDTKEAIGEFCADAGLVSVISLDQVLRYNPDFDYHTERKWTTTLIENFKGTIQFVVVRSTGIYDDTTEYHKKGDEWEDFEVRIKGEGINMKTNEPINFITSQTGL